MPKPGVALEKLGFLTIGLFDGRDPGPGHFDHDDYVQILTDMATRLGPALGWRPRVGPLAQNHP